MAAVWRRIGILGIGALLGLAGMLLLAGPAHASTYVVNSFGDDPDTTPGDDDCADLNGRCSLRAAIQEANAHAGPDVINFNIPGPVPRVLSPATQLPDVTSPVTIDGLTQGNIACPLPSGALNIQIDGGDVLDYGLRVRVGDGSVVRGLSVTNFAIGIRIEATDARVTCNYIGVEADGSDNGSNGNGRGIHLDDGTGVRIGGPNTGDGNVIASNTSEGVGIFASGGHTVWGNTIRDGSNSGITITGD